MRKLILSFIVVCLTSLYGMSQVKLMDLNALPVNGMNSGSDSINVLIQLKISNPANVQSITFLFGTQPDSGNVLSGTATVSQQGTNYMVTYNGKSEAVQNHDVRIYCPMSMTEYNAWQHLSVYTSDNTGENSNHLYQNR